MSSTIAPILVTAGPTYEPLDAVRFIGNRSSGRMGVAIAEAARAAGYKTILMLGPNCVLPSEERGDRLTVLRFRSCADLEALLVEYWPERANTLIMAAAVADFRPRPVKRNEGDSLDQLKFKRTGEGLTLELESTPDLVAACCARKTAGQLVIGFALEPASDLDARAAEKLKRKGLDAIVANPLEAMDAAEVEATLVTGNGRATTPGRMSKAAFAHWLIAQIPNLHRS